MVIFDSRANASVLTFISRTYVRSFTFGCVGSKWMAVPMHKTKQRSIHKPILTHLRNYILHDQKLCSEYLGA